MKKVIGITGSIGSGKSYAMEYFKNICKDNNIKATFLDVDDIRRSILEEENIDRTKLNKKIYNDKEEMKKYNDYIARKIKTYLTNVISKNNGIIFIECALLLEYNLHELTDSIILIYCKEEVQLERLRDGDLGITEVKKRMNLQLTNDQKLEQIKQLNKEFYVIDTTSNPDIKEYESVLKKEGLYE